MTNNGNDASANGNGGGDEEAVLAVVDQPAAEEGQQQDQQQQLAISAAGDDGNPNETANGGNDDDDEMVVDAADAEDTAGENTLSSSSSRYSLRKRSRKPLLSIQDSINATLTTTTSTSGRGRKKQQQSYDPNAAGYINAANLTDRQFEKLLQEYEEKGERQRAQKKQRLERGYADDDYPYEPPAEGCPALDALPKEAIRLVFELLPSARSVFNLAYQSKYMLSFVEKRVSGMRMVVQCTKCRFFFNTCFYFCSSTHHRIHMYLPCCRAIILMQLSQNDIVIRATVLEDARKYSTTQRSLLSSIVQLVRKRSIHVPSPLRLLKLVNAKHCERGTDCFAFDLKKGAASRKNMSYYQPFGFAICSACAKDCCTKAPKIWQYRYDHWIRQERIDGKIVFHGWRGLFDPDKGSDLCIGPNGERIGPVIDGRHLQHIANVHPRDTEEQKNLFAAMKKQEYGEEGSDKMEAFDKACADLVQIYEEAEKERKERNSAFWDKWKEDNKVKNDAVAASKKAKLQPIIAALEEAVADAPLKDMALDFEWKDSPYCPIKFRYHFVKDSLGKLLSAPSSASQKKVKAACANIRRKLEILSTMTQAEGDDEDFFSLDFLTTAHQECSSPLRKKTLQKISEYCRSNLTGGMKGIIGGEHWYCGSNDANNTNDRFFALLEGGPEKYVDAGKTFTCFYRRSP